MDLFQLVLLGVLFLCIVFAIVFAVASGIAEYKPSRKVRISSKIEMIDGKPTIIFYCEWHHWTGWTQFSNNDEDDDKVLFFSSNELASEYIEKQKLLFYV